MTNPDPYPVENWEAFEKWERDATPSPRERDTVLSWIELVADDPTKVESTPIMGTGLPVHVKIVPGTMTAISYCVIKSPPYTFRAIRLVRVETLPEEFV